MPLLDGPDKACGRVVFGADFVLPGMLIGKVCRSPLPHARILSLDTREAERLPGVWAVATGRSMDFPYYSVAGQAVLDDRVLALDKVHYMGDEVAAVAARDEDTAEEAVRLIKVEYEPLPAVFDVREAIAPGAPLVHERFGSNIAVSMDFTRGNPEAAFLEADVIVEEEFATPMVHQGYLEPQSGMATWSGDRLTVYISMQTPELARITYANALGITSDRIRVVQMPMGGAFGGKLEAKMHIIAAVLSKLAGRPVKMVNTRREEFMAATPRIPMVIRMKVGARSDGTLLAKDTTILAGNGAYTNYGPGIMLSAAHRHDNLYKVKNIHTHADLIWTNTPGTGCYRGFGNPQSHFAFESALDMVADELGMDPADLRLKNATETGEVTAHGWVIGSCGLSDCVRESTKMAGWAKKWSRWEGKDAGQGAGAGESGNDQKHVARGLGVACCLHVSGNRTFLPYFDGAGAFVRINEQGKVLVHVGETDLGQGARTVFAQMAAEELGIPVADVLVATVDTDISPHGLGTFGDRATTLGGNAVKNASAKARDMLLEWAAQAMMSREAAEAVPRAVAAGGGRPLRVVEPKNRISKDQLKLEDGIIYWTEDPEVNMTFREAACQYSYDHAGATLIAEGDFVVPGVSMVHPKTKYGNISCAYPFVAQVAEVEVDTHTGEVKVLAVYAAHDLGKTINPLLAEGQVQGALAQGLGFAITEQMTVRDGRITADTYRRYHMPRITDMPSIGTVFVESMDPVGPYGAKGLAEPALTPTAPAIANAVYNAVGVRITSLPITAPKVLAALREKQAQEKRAMEGRA